MTCRWLPFWLCLLVALECSVARSTSSNTDCSRWVPNTEQNVTVGSDVGLLALGPACNAVLRNINLTFFCFPNVTIHIDQWNFLGGYIALVGPPVAPWSVSDVTLRVLSSLVDAVGGPAVGVLLGYGWPPGSSLPTVQFNATNVSLLSLGSTLRSTSASASVLSCAMADFGNSVDVNVASCTFYAKSSTLTATGGVSAAVASIAIPQGGSVTVQGSHFEVADSSAVSAIDEGLQAVEAVATIAGVAVGYGSSVVVSNSNFAVTRCNVTSTSAASDNSASSVCGVAVGHAVTFVAVTASNHYVSRSLINSASHSGHHNAASGVGSIAVARAVNYVTVSGITSFVSRCNVTGASRSLSDNSVSSIGGAGVAFTNGYVVIADSMHMVSICSVWCSSSGDGNSATSSGGVAIADVTSSAFVSNSTHYVSRSNVTHISRSVNYNSASSVGSVAISFSNYVATIVQSRQYLWWSTVSVTDYGAAYSASTVGGVAVTYAISGATATDCTNFVSWCNVTCNGGNQNAASSIGGIAFAYTSASMILQCTHHVSWSDVESSATHSNSAATVGGVAVAYTSATSVSANSLNVSWSTVTISSDGSANAASSVGAIVTANADSNSKLSNNTLYMLGTKATSRAGGSCSASSVGGIAVANALNIVVTNVSHYVWWCVVTGTSVGGSVSASTIGGIGVTYARGFSSVNATQYILGCNVSSHSVCDLNAVSSVGGVAIANTLACFPIADNVNYVSSTNAISISDSKNLHTASSVGGVAVAYVDGAVSVATTTQIVTQSEAASNATTSVSGSCSQCHSASAVAAVVVISSSTPSSAIDASLSSANVLSQSRVSACALTLQHLCACGGAANATGDMCCSNASQALVPLRPPSAIPETEVVLPPIMVDTPAFEQAPTKSHTLRLRKHVTLTVNPPRWQNNRSGHHALKSMSRSGSAFATLTSSRTMRFRQRNMLSSRSNSLSMTLRPRLPHHRLSATVRYNDTPLTAAASRPGVDIHVLDTTSARVILDLGYGSAIVAASLSPTSANKPSTVARAVATAACTAYNSDKNAFPNIDPWSLLPSFPVFSDDAPSAAAGMLVSTVSVALVALLWNCVVSLD